MQVKPDGSKTVYVGGLLEVNLPASGAPPPPPPTGNVITVTTTTDELNTDGDCALREAIRATNLNQAVDACPAGGSAPVIRVPSGTYTLTRTGSDDTAINGDLDITRTVTFNGAGANLTIIKAGSGFCLLYTSPSPRD